MNNIFQQSILFFYNIFNRIFNKVPKPIANTIIKQPAKPTLVGSVFYENSTNSYFIWFQKDSIIDLNSYLIKYDGNTKLTFWKTPLIINYSPKSNRPVKILVDSNSVFALASTIDSFYIIAINHQISTSKPKWQLQFTDSYIPIWMTMDETNLYVVTYYAEKNNNIHGIRLFKISKNGNVIWTSDINSIDVDESVSDFNPISISNSNLILVGSFGVKVIDLIKGNIIIEYEKLMFDNIPILSVNYIQNSDLFIVSSFSKSFILSCNTKKIICSAPEGGMFISPIPNSTDYILCKTDATDASISNWQFVISRINVSSNNITKIAWANRQPGQLVNMKLLNDIIYVTSHKVDKALGLNGISYFKYSLSGNIIASQHDASIDDAYISDVDNSGRMWITTLQGYTMIVSK